MMEKRRSQRFIAKLDLEISSLFQQDNIKVENLNAPITVVDVSRNGIGFHSASVLPIGYYFNASLQLGQEEAKLYCVVKIVRSTELGDGIYGYGCEYVGMAPVLSYIFDDFEQQSGQTD